ncbi:MAG TPA: NUDIX hydrolase, partial [Terrimesophilobacter sp.]|nr:NUDIX hydrolase [Terrimesophilobacter sp.]
MIDSETAFEGAIWEVRRDRFRFGEGELVREYVDHAGSVAVLALDEDDRVVMLLQYRHSTGTRFWELPAGLRDVDGEDPRATAQRELAEEVELAARDWRELVDYFP